MTETIHRNVTLSFLIDASVRRYYIAFYMIFQ